MSLDEEVGLDIEGEFFFFFSKDVEGEFKELKVVEEKV